MTWGPMLLSIQVAMPQQYGSAGMPEPMERPWTTAFFKQPIVGPVWAGRTNLAGDGQADLVNHGGTDKAILAYAADHYPAWKTELSLSELPYGAFGENLTIGGQNEWSVCIGDVWQLGDARLEVSQPRLPCWKLARRWRIKDLALRVDRTGRSGWYLRVLDEGNLCAGQPLKLIDRPLPEWSIARANRLWHHDKSNLVDAAALAALPQLSASWQEMLARRLAKTAIADESRRTIGPNS